MENGLRKTCGSRCVQDNGIQIVASVVRVDRRDLDGYLLLFIKIKEGGRVDEFDIIIGEGE